MYSRLRMRYSVVVFALAVSMLSACGVGAASSGAHTSGNKQLVIATELPVSGLDAAGGLPAQYGVDLAVQQNADLGDGYTLSVRHFNYVGTAGVDPAIGAADMTQAVSDPSIIAVVGPFNSGVARVEIPLLTRGHLVTISPSNTTPGLTKQQYAQADGVDFTQLHPPGIPEYYFRLPGTDDIQGKLDAQIAAAPPINAKTVFIVDDDSTYGIGLANYFANAFQKQGGTILGRMSVTGNQASSFESLATTIADKQPDVLFYGGVSSSGGDLLMKALVVAGYDNPIVGGDGIAEDPNWVKAAGNVALPTYATVAAPDISQFTSGAAATFVQQYKAAFPGALLIPYSAMAYDAAMIEIHAIKALISAGKSVTREHVRDQVAAIRYDGVTGRIAFDAGGDNAGSRVFSVYWLGSATHDQWVFREQVSV